ncbi:MAG: HRDC domain-containing protein [Verrucomicrobia bacterium]|nr:HRDC domain-containing protein [Verrucomicrobiota bacterium]
MIQSAAQLAHWLPALGSSPWLAVDTEADSLHSYPEKLCLVQLATPTDTVLVDPLAGFSLDPLWQAARDKELILHGADYDLRLLFRTFEFRPHRVFDTMLAARLLGRKQFGLASLVEELLGVKLEKGSQKANWALRPLSAKMTAYALDDARYLAPLADKLREELRAAGRLEWHEQFCAQLVEEAARSRNGVDPEAWRIKGVNRLGPRSLGVARELWRWREREAVEKSRPPFFILAHETLIAIAERAGAGADYAALVPRRFPDSRREGLRRAVERGLALPDEELPGPLVRRSHRLTGAQRSRLEQLRRRRDRLAAKLNLEASFIASKATLVALARNEPGAWEGLLPWQRELLSEPAGRSSEPRPTATPRRADTPPSPAAAKAAGP